MYNIIINIISFLKAKRDEEESDKRDDREITVEGSEDADRRGGEGESEEPARPDPARTHHPGSGSSGWRLH